MLDRNAAWQAAQDWCEAWNRRDLEAILAHYTDDVVLVSPVAVQRLGRPDGTVRGKAELREYFARGLRASGLRFELQDVLLGMDGMAVVYRRETGALVADVVELDAAGKGRRVHAFYGAATS
jgi:ketosteroid isomerase-like protein